jgi:uncharacterized membrane protein
VRGLKEVDNRLELHRTADGVPALQGGGARRRPRSEYLQENWAPGPRLLAFGAGAGLVAWGFGKRNAGCALLGLAGAALAARAASNQPLGRLLGVGGGHRGIDVHKSIHIAAPRERVFDLWSRPENFPHFMSMVEEVRPLAPDRTHWVVKGPAGAHLEWDAQITRKLPPQLLAWRSEPGAPVQHAGIVHFEDEGDGTRVDVRLSYHPPAGALGHTVAALSARDPKQDLDQDLMRMKSFIETGTIPHDAARP